MEIQLTDDSDPYFLYLLEINEDEFRKLKQEQALLVDFAQFPYKVIELFELCIQSSTQPNPKFIAQLKQDSKNDTATFSLIETNSFKSIDHLSLKLSPGNDSTTKKYLGQVVKDLKAEKLKLEHKVESLSSRLLDAEKYANRATSTLDEVKLLHAEELNNIKLKHSSEIFAEREKFNAEIDKLRVTKDETLRLDSDRHSSEAN